MIKVLVNNVEIELKDNTFTVKKGDVFTMIDIRKVTMEAMFDQEITLNNGYLFVEKKI